MDCIVDLAEAVPFVIIFSLAADQVKAFEDVDDIIYSSSLNSFEIMMRDEFFLQNYKAIFDSYLDGQ